MRGLEKTMKIKTAASFVYNDKFVDAGTEIDVDADFLNAQNELLAAFRMPLHTVLEDNESETKQNKTKSKPEKPENGDDL